MRPPIEMTYVQVLGVTYGVPKMLADELTRLRALEHQWQDSERDRLMREYERVHGQLPAPLEPRWVEVDHHGFPVSRMPPSGE